MSLSMPASLCAVGMQNLELVCYGIRSTDHQCSAVLLAARLPGHRDNNHFAFFMCGVCKRSTATAVVAAWPERAPCGEWEALVCGRLCNARKR